MGGDMNSKKALILAACVAALVATTGAVQAGAPAGAAPAAPAGPRPYSVTAIPGVVAAGAQWELIWASTMSADGFVGSPDGGIWFAQEQSDTIKKLDTSNKEWIYLTDTHGTGSISVDAKGRMFAAQRTCTDSAKPFYQSCQELTAISQIAPERRLLANSFKDGRTFGRLNDLIADGKGGAYFTSNGAVNGAWHVTADGDVTVVEEKDIRSNGITLSPDMKTLYVTNNTGVLAFDVAADGSTSRRRDFAILPQGDGGADGMAIDNTGRLYVTTNLGVQVYSPTGQSLGLIPTPRRPISLAFSGPDKKVLFAPMSGAIGLDGKEWVTPLGVRNVGFSIYRIQMQAEGFKGRPK